jgi:hypothetical protein
MTKPDFSYADKEALPAGKFLAFIDRLSALAENFTSEHDPSLLVLDFLRHGLYDNLEWAALVGETDKEFIGHVESSGLEFVGFFRDPMYGFPFKVAHFAASCTGVYRDGNPAGTGVNRADVAGWGGDWITFYADWRREHRGYASGRAFCADKLMRASARSTFELSDLMEDVDAYNVAMRLRAGEKIGDVVSAFYGDGGRRARIEPFFKGRFGDEQTARADARNMLLSRDDELINVGRDLLVEDTAGEPVLLPGMLETGTLDDFCQGFAEVLVRRMAEERSLLA